MGRKSEGRPIVGRVGVEHVSVSARLRRIATFLFIGALEAYLLT